MNDALPSDQSPSDQSSPLAKNPSRRAVLKTLAGAGGAALLGASPAPASPRSGSSPRRRRSSRRRRSPSAAPAAGPVLLRGGYLMTMGPRGDHPEADLLVRGGRIAALGKNLGAPPEAEEIDLRGHLVLPGLVDTHTHLWLTQMRGLFGNTRESAYFPLVERLARAYRPEDIRAGTLLGAAESLSAGITFTAPFFDNARAPAFAEAALGALAEAGIRARFLYGGYDAMPPDEALDLGHVATLAENWERWSGGGLLSLGVGWGGPFDSGDERVADLVRREHRRVRQLGLPLSVHASGDGAGATIDGLAESGYLGPGVQLVHATGATPAQVEMINEAGASVTLTPVTEHRVGFGLTRLEAFAGVERLGLGVDGPALAGSADLFEAMRLLALTESGASRSELAASPRRMLRLATIEGARALGLENTIGSLEEGKQADVIALDLREVNLGRFFEADPAPLALYSAKPSNVKLVVVGGQLRKRGGALVGTDPGAVLRAATGSIEAVRRRAGAAE